MCPVSLAQGQKFLYKLSATMCICPEQYNCGLFDYVHQCDSLGEETLSVASGFCKQCSVAPSWRQQFEEFMSRMWRVCRNVFCPFPNLNMFWMKGVPQGSTFFSSGWTFKCSLVFLCTNSVWVLICIEVLWQSLHFHHTLKLLLKVLLFMGAWWKV